LRERRKDIPLLITHFLRAFMASGHRQDIRGLTPRAMNALINYPWPGNVRQLKNWIEQALVLADGDLIDLEHFPSLTRESSDVMVGSQAPLAPLGLRLEELERWYVLETLKRVDGNRTKAARQLGISLRGLQYKLRRYGTNLGGGEPPDVTGGGAGGSSVSMMRQWHERPGASMNG
jgi:two-component system response regulator HydG